ncbi:MAG: HD domain-containing protein [bacterium]|nr:HD domain-containing protein [bacterium]
MIVTELIPPEALGWLKEVISEKRYNHCLGVLDTAFQLAEAWSGQGYDIDRNHLAWSALFHDCAKEIDAEGRAALIAEGRIVHGKELLTQPPLEHAPLGALLLRRKFDLDEYDVMMAIAYHPTGHPNLTPMGWIVYLADFLEPGRTYYDFRADYFNAALANPLSGLRLVTDAKIQSVRDKKRSVHPIAYQVKSYIDSIERI